MARQNMCEVLQQLATEGLLEADRQAEAAAVLAGYESPSPWYLRFMVGFGAWLSAFFFIGFFSLLTHSRPSALGFGLLLIIGAVTARRLNRGDFFNQLALAASLAGQLLVLYGSDIQTASGIAMLLLLIQALLIAVYADRTHRLLSTLLAAGAIEALLFEWKLTYGTPIFAGLLGLAAIGLWLKETLFTSLGLDRLVRPLAYGVVIAMFGLLLLSVFPPAFDRNNPLTLQLGHLWLSTLLLGGGLLYLVIQLLQERGQSPTNGLGLACIAAVLVLMWPALQAPGLIGALIVLLLGFRRGNRLLWGMALLFLAIFLSAYYYHLSISLLLKSAALAGSGLVLLELRWVLLKQLSQPEAGHAD